MATTKDAPQPETPPWHGLDADAVVAQLGTSPSAGLRDAEVEERLEQYGPNELSLVEKTRWYAVLGRQFVDVLIWILLIAAAFTFMIGEVADTITILAIVVLNGILGFVQEWKAERALEALRQMLSPRCRVVRDGHDREIEAATLVPGDVVVLEIGDRVPADLRLVMSLNLKIDESALTGESFSVSKQVQPVRRDAPLAERSSMAWMGTAATNGRAHGVVVATGTATEFGRIARLTEAIGAETTPLQRKLGLLGKQLGVVAILISILVAVVGWLTGKELLEMFLTGVSLAMAVVPEGLPAVVTITLALGIRAMARRRALLRRLQAAEALGAASVICTDKTGTLTENQMTVQRIWLPAGEVEVTGVGYDPQGHFEENGRRLDYRQRPDLLALLETGLRCNHARIHKDEEGWHEFGEPTEAALVVAAHKAWLDPDDGSESISEFSFNSTRKRMTVVEHRPEGKLTHVKGAPEVILERCTRIRDGDEERMLGEADRRAVNEAYLRMAEHGLRTLALARRILPDDCPLDEDAVESDLTFLGVVAMIDPARTEVPGAIRLASTAGIHVIMITGDAAPTALAIAGQVGLPVDRAVTGPEVDTMDDESLRGAVRQGVVFARTTPEHKLRIVTLLQDLGHVVGMTGDGVNDAPALKKADIGIAMGLRGTDVAKGAADIVLTDDNFSSIINAVEEGRRQYDNIQKFVGYLLSSNTGEVVAIFINIATGGPLILLPVQILWMNLVTDGLTAVALGLEPAEAMVMQRPPRNPRESVLTKRSAGMVLLLGSYIGAVTLWLFYHYQSTLGPEGFAVAQTAAFTGIIMAEKWNVMNFRSLRAPLSTVGFFSNPWVLLAVAFAISLQVCAVYVPVMQTALHTVPLGWQDWLLIVAVASPIFFVTEAVKWWRWRVGQRRKDSIEISKIS